MSAAATAQILANGKRRQSWLQRSLKTKDRREAKRHQRGQHYVDKPNERQYARGTSGEVVGAGKSPENAGMDSPAEFNLMPIVGGGKINEANTPAQNQTWSARTSATNTGRQAHDSRWTTYKHRGIVQQGNTSFDIQHNKEHLKELSKKPSDRMASLLARIGRA